MTFHSDQSFNAVVNEALARVQTALTMAEQNRDHARAHNATGVAAADARAMHDLIRAQKALIRAVRS